MRPRPGIVTESQPARQCEEATMAGPDQSAAVGTGAAVRRESPDDAGAGRGAGSRAVMEPDGAGPATFRGENPDTVARPAISESTPTKCQARTRLYRDGVLELEGFPVADISDYLLDESAVVWLDLRDPDRDDLAVLSAEFGLHPLAVEDAEQMHERAKLDRYKSHLFLAAYAVHLDTGTGQLFTSELAAFITPRALITVRKDDGLDI